MHELEEQIRQLTIAELAALDGIEVGDEVRLDGFDFGGREHCPARPSYFDEDGDLVEAVEELPYVAGSFEGTILDIQDNRIIVEDCNSHYEISIFDYEAAKPVKLMNDEELVLRLKANYLVTYRLHGDEQTMICWILDPEDKAEIAGWVADQIGLELWFDQIEIVNVALVPPNNN